MTNLLLLSVTRSRDGFLCALALLVLLTASNLTWASGDTSLDAAKLNPTPKLSLNSYSATAKPEKIDVQQLKGTVVVVNFWATWCAPCVQELPSLQRLQDKYPADKVRVLAVSVGDTDAKIKALLDKVPLSMTILKDSDGKTSGAWKAKALPVTYIIDKKGKAVLMARGDRAWDAPGMTKQIDALLK